MRKFSKKLFVGVVALLLVAGLFPTKLQAAGTVEYTYKKLDNSQKFKGGTWYNYYKYPVLKGSTKGIKKMNANLKKVATNFVEKGNKEISWLSEAIPEWSESFGTRIDCYNTGNSKVAYNDNNILSLRIHTYWTQMSNGCPDRIYGAVYNVKTGKKLRLANVMTSEYNPKTSKGYKNLRKAIKEKLQERQYTSDDVASAFLKQYNTKKKLNKMYFYINKHGNAVVCFPAYDIGAGADGNISVTLPSKYSK